MRAVKNAFDPKGILNSGKVLPPISTQEGVDKK
jgi:FAD/FMN-containing dehydrogenase